MTSRLQPWEWGRLTSAALTPLMLQAQKRLQTPCGSRQSEQSSKDPVWLSTNTPEPWREPFLHLWARFSVALGLFSSTFHTLTQDLLERLKSVGRTCTVWNSEVQRWMQAMQTAREGTLSQCVCVCVWMQPRQHGCPIGERVELPPSHTIIWPILVVLTGKLEEVSPRASPQEGLSAPAHGPLFLWANRCGSQRLADVVGNLCHHGRCSLVEPWEVS